MFNQLSKGSTGVSGYDPCYLAHLVLLILHSFSTVVLRSLIQSYTRIYGLKTCLPRFMPFLVRFAYGYFVPWLILMAFYFSCPHVMCLHATSRSSTTALGLPSCIWCSPQCALRDCTAFAHPRWNHELIQVNPLFYSSSVCCLRNPVQCACFELSLY